MGEEARRCACGTKLNSYNTTGVCGPCAVAESDEWIRQAQLPPKPPDPPKPRVCRVPGCGEPLSERAAMTTAPRWRDLCEDHYNVERARQSELAYCRAKVS